MDAKSRAQIDARALKRTASERFCGPVEGSLMDRFKPSHIMPAAHGLFNTVGVVAVLIMV